MGEPAPSSQDLKGWEKQEKDERQQAPRQGSENGPFPTFLQPLQLGLPSAIRTKKLIVISSSKLIVKEQYSV